jgi:prevent-host-death family protein
MEVIPDEIAIGDARANLSEVLNAVRLQDRKVRLARRGTPQAVVLPPDFDGLIDALGGLDAARTALREAVGK